MTIKSILGTALILLLPLGQAHALVLNNWNDVDLDASGDYIQVETGTIGTDTWFGMQWRTGADNTLTALGIQTVFYNCEGCDFTNKKDDDATKLGGVKAVWENAIGLGGTDVTADWETNFGGDTPGGGFGSMNSRKSHEGGTLAGIDPDWLYFVLSGKVTFVDNGSPTFATFAAHVRYENDCSGWASDGITKEASSGSCGKIPAPATAWLIGLGLGLVGFARRKA